MILARRLVAMVSLLFTVGIMGQSLSVEMMTGERNFWFQQVLSHPFGKSGLGFFSTSSLHAFYRGSQGHELMSQSYATYALIKNLKVGVGTFYSSAPGFRPSLNLQLSARGKDYALLVVTRTDLRRVPSRDIMLMLEWKPYITARYRLYSRIQAMVNLTGTSHNRSYLNIRAGADLSSFQAGVAVNLDAYGEQPKPYSNFGLFIRKDIRH